MKTLATVEELFDWYCGGLENYDDIDGDPQLVQKLTPFKDTEISLKTVKKSARDTIFRFGGWKHYYEISFELNNEIYTIESPHTPFEEDLKIVEKTDMFMDEFAIDFLEEFSKKLGFYKGLLDLKMTIETSVEEYPQDVEIKVSVEYKDKDYPETRTFSISKKGDQFKMERS